MAAVWNKLTSHISTWFGDEKKNFVEIQTPLRPSCSLSMLNQKNMQIRVVRSSKSSENLHKIQQKQLTSHVKQDPLASHSLNNYEQNTPNHTTSKQTSRKKSLASTISHSNFLHNLRMLKKQPKQAKPDSTSPSSTTTTVPLTSAKNSKGENSSSSTRSDFSGSKSSRNQHPQDPAPVSATDSNLHHTLPISLSWHNNLNSNNIQATATLMNNLAGYYPPPTTILSFNNYGTKPNGSFGYEVGRGKPKRSRSVGAVHHHDLNVRAEPTANGYWMNGHGSGNGSIGRDGCATPLQGVANVGFRTPQSVTAYQCNQQVIDANFLALGQKEQPVMSSDLMFRRLEKLGEGSYATVFKSENRIDGSIVALKEIKLQPQEGLPFTAIREVSLLRGLKHANIVRLHQIVHQPHSLILVFEYMKTDLSKLMDNYRHGLDSFRVKIFMFQLLRGLAFCHDKKILHRDLKPQNLLVSEEGELKLADFGLARAKSVPCRTFSHDVVTLWYRPPDVLLGSTHYSTSLDMWGVGCIFAEMCSGIALFPGMNDVHDQLDKIFSIRGLPDEEKWPEVKDLPNYANFHFSPYVKLRWNQVDPQLARLPDQGDCLLSALLQLKPSDRISARKAMKHHFFCTLPAIVHDLQSTQSVVETLQTRTYDGHVDTIEP